MKAKRTDRGRAKSRLGWGLEIVEEVDLQPRHLSPKRENPKGQDRKSLLLYDLYKSKYTERRERTNERTNGVESVEGNSS